MHNHSTRFYFVPTLCWVGCPSCWGYIPEEDGARVCLEEFVVRSGDGRGEVPFLPTQRRLWITLMGSPWIGENLKSRETFTGAGADMLVGINSQYMADSTMASDYPHLLVFMPLVIPSPQMYAGPRTCF